MLDKVINIAIDAGNILMNYYKRPIKIKYKKHDNTTVTKADLEVDKYIRKRLEKEFPKDQILSEENKKIPKDYSKNVWVVDPLDGTRSFTEQKDGFCVIIGLCIKGIPNLGVLYAPARGEIYYAQKSKGAYIRKNGVTKKLKVKNTSTISNSIGMIHPLNQENNKLSFLLDNIKIKKRVFDNSAGMRVVNIANAKADFYIEASYKTSKWDTCGGQVILVEAGGQISDIFGNKLDYTQKHSKWKNPLIISNKKIHKKLITKIKRYI